MKKLTLALAATLILAACSAADTAEKPATETAKAPAATPAAKTEVAKVDLTAAPSGAYTLDKGHGYITFTYLHQGYSNPYVRWRDWDSTLNWNQENPAASSVTVTINAASIDSGVDKFDNHLKSADFFEVETYPTVNFVSTSLKQTGANTGVMTGDLTVKDTTKPVTLDVVFNKAGQTRDGGSKIGFSAKGRVKRSDYGLDLYVPNIADDVDLVIEVEYEKAP